MIDETDMRERLARIETMTEHISRDMHSIQTILGRTDGRMHRAEMDIVNLHRVQHHNITRLSRLEADTELMVDEYKAKRVRQAIWHYVFTGLMTVAVVAGLIGDEAGGALIGLWR